jgi:NADPH-dependent F420 reductase
VLGGQTKADIADNPLRLISSYCLQGARREKIELREPQGPRQLQETTMNIAIIGNGSMGQALGALLAARHKITFGSRQPSSARETAAKLGGTAQGTSIVSVREALEQGEIVILTVPYEAALELASQPEVKKALEGKVVVDATNPLAADIMSLTIGHTTSAGEEIAKRLPESRVVKAFNTIFADVIKAKAQGQGVDVTVFCAGDDAQAKAQVAAIVADSGFSVVDAGPLKNSRYLEPITELELQLAFVLGHSTQMGFRLVEAASAKAKA